MVMMMKWDAGSGYIGSSKKPKRESFEKLVFLESIIYSFLSVLRRLDLKMCQETTTSETIKTIDLIQSEYV